MPRDAINLLGKVAAKSFGKTASVEVVRAAAKEWFETDKAEHIRANEALGLLLQYIVDDIIGTRKARAFLFESRRRNQLLESLYDARVLHILKKGISSKEEAGKRYDVYKIDYGCYVDLINTSKAPQGLFETDDGAFVEVPEDDYRSIRRAVLSEEQIEKLVGQLGSSNV